MAACRDHVISMAASYGMYTNSMTLSTICPGGPPKPDKRAVMILGAGWRDGTAKARCEAQGSAPGLCQEGSREAQQAAPDPRVRFRHAIRPRVRSVRATG